MIVDHELRARTSPARGYCANKDGKTHLICCSATQGPTVAVCGRQLPSGECDPGAEGADCQVCVSINQDPDVCPLYGRCLNGTV